MKKRPIETHTMSELIKRLMEAGITRAKTKEGAKQTIHYWIRKGKLRPRQLPNSGYYIFTDIELNQIVEAFSPGGAGWWDWEEYF